VAIQGTRQLRCLHPYSVNYTAAGKQFTYQEAQFYTTLYIQPIHTAAKTETERMSDINRGAFYGRINIYTRAYENLASRYTQEVRHFETSDVRSISSRYMTVKRAHVYDLRAGRLPPIPAAYCSDVKAKTWTYYAGNHRQNERKLFHRIYVHCSVL